MKPNPHDKHRERLRQIFLECNPEKLPDHMILEFLLCYAIPRIDTNGIAHELINRFGGLENALDADIEELMKVPGIGENSALLLKTVPLLCSRYAANKLRPRLCFQSTQKAAEFFIEYYLSKNKEIVSALLLDNADRLICHTELHEGAVNSSNVNIRKLAQIALSYNAASIILAHNHPSGDPTPSDADLYTTKQLMKAFSGIDLSLKAHIVVAGNRYVDAVKVVEEHAKYQVRYMAFRADNLPPSFEGAETEQPVPPPADKEHEKQAPRKGTKRKSQKDEQVEEVPLTLPAFHYESWTAKLSLPPQEEKKENESKEQTEDSLQKEAKKEAAQKKDPDHPIAEKTQNSAPKKASPQKTAAQKAKAGKGRKKRPLPAPETGPVLTIPQAIQELESQAEKENKG